MILRSRIVSHLGVGWLAGLIVLGLNAGKAFAEGREYSAHQHDLSVLVDTRWCGCRHGGYYPIRIKLTNLGPARNLTFRFTPNDQRLPGVEKIVGAEQNATVQFTLPIPMTGNGQYGSLAVLLNEASLQGLRWDFSLPDVSWNEPPRPSLLMIAGNNPDSSSFEQAVQLKFNPGGGAAYSRSYGASVSEDHQVVPPSLLPESWIDYSGLDLVSVPLETLKGMNSNARNALIGWVETGGTLLVTQVGGPANDSDVLKKLLALEGRAALSKSWVSARKELRTATVLPAAPVENAGLSGVVPTIEPVPNEGNPGQVDERLTDEYLAEYSWPLSEEAFQIRDVMRGRVVAFPKDPYPGTPKDWLWLLASLPADSLRWNERNGFSARRPSDEFLNFEIPGLRGVPVSALLVLMTIFGLAIGPVNYFLLWKRKKLWMLVVTIPAIAFGTSAALFGYSAMANGFGVKSRTRSLTWLDQTNRTAFSTARISLFAGLSPGRGLTFSPETSVMPIWSGASNQTEPGRVDWTETQHLDSKWIRSRTRVQFLTQQRRTERGRLVIGSPEGDSIRVENGFPWEIETLAVVDDQGLTYSGGPLPAGAAVTLKRTENEQVMRTFNQQISQFPMRPPDGVNFSYPRHPGHYRGGYYSSSGYGYPDSSMGAWSFSTSRMEREIQGIVQPGSSMAIYSPRTYVASFVENPGIEMGLEPVSERGPMHLMIGKY